MGFLPTAASRHKCLQSHPKIQRQNTVFSTSSTSTSFIPRFLPALSSLACLTMCSTSWKLMKFATWRSQIHQTEAGLDFAMERKKSTSYWTWEGKIVCTSMILKLYKSDGWKANKLQPNKMTTRLFLGNSAQGCQSCAVFCPDSFGFSDLATASDWEKCWNCRMFFFSQEHLWLWFSGTSQTPWFDTLEVGRYPSRRRTWWPSQNHLASWLNHRHLWPPKKRSSSSQDGHMVEVTNQLLEESVFFRGSQPVIVNTGLAK